MLPYVLFLALEPFLNPFFFNESEKENQIFCFRKAILKS